MTLMQSSIGLGKRNRQWRGSRKSTHPLTDIERGACEAVARQASQARSERFCWTFRAECSRQTAGFGFVLLLPCFPGFVYRGGEAKNGPKGPF